MARRGHAKPMRTREAFFLVLIECPMLASCMAAREKAWGQSMLSGVDSFALGADWVWT